jgi:hypothetical protein
MKMKGLRFALGVVLQCGVMSSGVVRFADDALSDM